VKKIFSKAMLAVLCVQVVGCSGGTEAIPPKQDTPMPKVDGGSKKSTNNDIQQAPPS